MKRTRNRRAIDVGFKDAHLARGKFNFIRMRSALLLLIMQCEYYAEEVAEWYHVDSADVIKGVLEHLRLGVSFKDGSFTIRWIVLNRAGDVTGTRDLCLEFAGDVSPADAIKAFVLAVLVRRAKRVAKTGREHAAADRERTAGSPAWVEGRSNFEEMEAADALLSSLTDLERAAVLLKQAGLSQIEIAERLGKTRKQIQKLFKGLRGRLGGA